MFPQQPHALFHYRLRRARPGGDQYGFIARKPLQINVRRAVDQMARHAAGRGHLRQSPAVRTVAAADDQHNVGLGNQPPHGLLPILSSIAYIIPLGTDGLGKTTVQVLDASGAREETLTASAARLVFAP